MYVIVAIQPASLVRQEVGKKILFGPAQEFKMCMPPPYKYTFETPFINIQNNTTKRLFLHKLCLKSGKKLIHKTAVSCPNTLLLKAKSEISI